EKAGEGARLPVRPETKEKEAAKDAPAATEKPVEKPAEKAAEKADEAVSAEEGLKLLKEGNARWGAGKPENPATEAWRRELLAEAGQKPFVTVLACSDSRVPVERLFDRGVGDVFVVRVAGNVIGGDESGSIEYGIEHLHTPLLVIMGHTKCGAVQAAATHA